MRIPFQDLGTCRRAVDWRRGVRMNLGWQLRLLEGRFAKCWMPSASAHTGTPKLLGHCGAALASWASMSLEA